MEKAKIENYCKFREPFKLTNEWREKIELEAILDPANLIMLSKNFIELGYLEQNKIAEFIIACIDLCLIYSVLLIHDNQSLISLELFSHVIVLIQAAIKNIELFAGKADLLSRISQSNIIKWLVSFISDDQMRDNMREKNQFLAIIEITDALTQLKVAAADKINENLELSFEADMTEKFKSTLEAIKILRDGTAFTSEINNVKFATLLASNDPQIKEIGRTYATFPQRLRHNISMTLPAQEEDWAVKIES